MPVSHVMNLIPKEDINGFDWMKTYIKTDELVFFGVRDIDNDEKLTLKENKIKCFTPDHIHKNGGKITKDIDLVNFYLIFKIINSTTT